MKFLINSITLAKLIGQVIKTVPTRSNMPILSNILIDASDVLRLSAFNIAEGIQASCECEIVEQGSICAPATILSDIVKSMTNELILETTGTLLTITSLTSSVEIQCCEADDFPDFLGDLPKQMTEYILDAAQTIKVIETGSACASDDASKFVLQGVNISMEGGAIKAASTNGHYLIICQDKHRQSDITIDAMTISTNLFKGLRPGKQEELTLMINKDSIKVCYDNLTLVSRAYIGAYPEVEKLIPAKFDRIASINSLDFIEAINLIALVSPHTQVAKFTFERDILTIDGKREGLKGGSKVNCSLDDSLDTSNFEVYLNIRYVQAALKALSCPDVTISMRGALDPLILDSTREGIETKYLIMPVRVASDIIK